MLRFALLSVGGSPGLGMMDIFPQGSRRSCSLVGRSELKAKEASKQAALANTAPVTTSQSTETTIGEIVVEDASVVRNATELSSDNPDTSAPSPLSPATSTIHCPAPVIGSTPPTVIPSVISLAPLIASPPTMPLNSPSQAYLHCITTTPPILTTPSAPVTVPRPLLPIPHPGQVAHGHAAPKHANLLLPWEGDATPITTTFYQPLSTHPSTCKTSTIE